MRIVFCELDVAYELLKGLEDQEDPQGSWEDQPGDGGVIEAQPKQIITDIGCPFVPIIHPLRKGVLYFSRRKGNYDASFGVVSEDPEVFKNSSEIIQESVREKMGQEFSITNDDGMGYVLGEDRVPILSIGEAQSRDQRVFYLGGGGAKPQEFSSFGSFKESLKQLEDLVNIGIDAWLKPLEKEGEIEIPTYYIYVTV